jgi:hypothetical protein
MAGRSRLPSALAIAESRVVGYGRLFLPIFIFLVNDNYVDYLSKSTTFFVF